MKVYHIRYTAWQEGARMPVHGEFDLPARNEEDARQLCALRWPEMMIEEIRERAA